MMRHPLKQFQVRYPDLLRDYLVQQNNHELDELMDQLEGKNEIVTILSALRSR